MTTALEPATDPGLDHKTVAAFHDFVEWIGETPGRNETMRILGIGAPKARALIDNYEQPAPDLAEPEKPINGIHIGHIEIEAPKPAPQVIDTTPEPEPTAEAAAEPQTRPAQSKWRKAALITPLVLVNAAAIYGQQAWAYDNLDKGRAVAILFACSLESIGIFLAAVAHGALMAGDASARLRLGSYLVGVLVGCLNYAHFASADFGPNPVALTFGLLSSISPWLWAIHSRSLNRDRLRELGQIDPRAVRFSLLRWALYPIRTWRAFRHAVWVGIVQPSEAVAAADRLRPAPTPEPVSVPA